MPDTPGKRAVAMWSSAFGGRAIMLVWAGRVSEDEQVLRDETGGVCVLKKDGKAEFRRGGASLVMDVERIRDLGPGFGLEDFVAELRKDFPGASGVFAE